MRSGQTIIEALKLLVLIRSKKINVACTHRFLISSALAIVEEIKKE